MQSNFVPQVIKTEDDEFVSKVAKTVKDVCALVEAGYEYVRVQGRRGQNLQET